MTRQSTERKNAAQRVTLIGMVVNLVLSGFKLLAGVLGHSVAMIADAIHSLSDLATDLVVIFGVIFGSKPRDRSHSYGHGKIETLAAAVVALALFATAGGILISGIKDVLAVLNGQALESPRPLALVAALTSIVCKEWLYRITRRVAVKIRSEAVLANAWHHRSDALSSLAVGLGIGGAIILGQDWAILDPASAMLVSFFIFKIAWKILSQSMNELIEGALPDEEEQKIIEIINGVIGCHGISEIRTRKIGSVLAIDLDAFVDGELTVREGHAIATRIERELRKVYGHDTMVSVHIEPLPRRKRGLVGACKNQDKSLD